MPVRSHDQSLVKVTFTVMTDEHPAAAATEGVEKASSHS
jgi:hypothetical protein